MSLFWFVNCFRKFKPCRSSFKYELYQILPPSLALKHKYDGRCQKPVQMWSVCMLTLMKTNIKLEKSSQISLALQQIERKQADSLLEDKWKYLLYILVSFSDTVKFYIWGESKASHLSSEIINFHMIWIQIFLDFSSTCKSVWTIPNFQFSSLKMLPVVSGVSVLSYPPASFTAPASINQFSLQHQERACLQELTNTDQMLQIELWYHFKYSFHLSQEQTLSVVSIITFISKHLAGVVWHDAIPHVNWAWVCYHPFSCAGGSAYIKSLQ